MCIINTKKTCMETYNYKYNVYTIFKNLKTIWVKTGFPCWSKQEWQQVLPRVDSKSLELFVGMVVFDPDKHITAKQALLHMYFDYVTLVAPSLITKPKKTDTGSDNDH